MFFLPGRIRDNFRLKVLAVAVFFIAHLFAYAPILPLERTWHTNSHVTLLGFSNRFTETLGLYGSLYEWSHVHSDPWPIFQIKSYGLFEKGSEERIPMYSKEYDRIGMQILLDRVLDFPADIVVRAYASVMKIVKMPILFSCMVLLAAVHSQRYALFLFISILYFCGYPGTQFDPRHYFHLEFVPLWLP